MCTHPGCGKTFTRPYDLKKHGLTQHQQRSPKEQGGRAAGTTNPCRAKRPIAEVSTPEFPPPAPRKSQMLSRTESLPPRKGQAPLTVVSLPTSLASLPPPHAPPKPAAHFDVQYRKRVRCEAHKQCDPVHVIGANLDEATVSGKEERVNDSRVSGSGVGGSESQPYRGGTGGATNAAGAGDTKVHIHGASCGHVAILHENHVDFLMEGGKLECYNGKEVRSLCTSIISKPFFFGDCLSGVVVNCGAKASTLLTAVISSCCVQIDIFFEDRPCRGTIPQRATHGLRKILHDATPRGKFCSDTCVRSYEAPS